MKAHGATKGVRASQQLPAQLEDDLAFYTKAGRTNSFEVRYIELLRRNGWVCHPQPRPKGVRKGRPQRCYANAFELASCSQSDGFEDDRLFYTEGYAWKTSEPQFKFRHGWCVDEHLTVVDPTLDNPQDYVFVGIPLLQTAVFRVWREEFPGYIEPLLEYLITTGREDEIDALLEPRFLKERCKSTKRHPTPVSAGTRRLRERQARAAAQHGR